MADDVVIHVEGLWKRYGLPLTQGLRRSWSRLRSHGSLSSAADDHDGGPWALRDVSFEVRRGDTLGIIGRNGAGKSTLLKVLAGVTPPTRGHVEVRGRVFPMIELGAGIHAELTGRENVYLLGAVMGLSRHDVDARIARIEDFCELGDWFDRPVRMYSTGMVARLGFAVAANVENDILLIDETFSVGDLKFQNKCLANMRRMRESGVTILLVTHSLDMLQFVTQRGIVLDDGKITAGGSSLEALSYYERAVFRLQQQDFENRVSNRISSGEATIHSAHIYGADGESAREVDAGSPFGIEVEFDVHRLLEDAVFSLGIVNASGVLCVWNVSAEDGLTCQNARGRFTLRIWYPENNLMKGTYEVHFALRDGKTFETLERLAGIASFSVGGSRRARGIVTMKPSWQLA